MAWRRRMESGPFRQERAGYNARMPPDSNNKRFGLSSLKPLAGRALEASINRLIALDPETIAALSALDGRCIQIKLQAPSLAMQLRVNATRIEVGPVPDDATADGDEPDLEVRSTLGGLLSQLPFLRSTGSSAGGGLRIAGDADLARTLQQLAQRFDPDWARPFADVFGDVIGVQIANALRAALLGGRNGARSLARNGADYLTEESRDVVGRDELDAFHDDVDTLREQVERVAAKAALLQGKLPADSQGSDLNDSPPNPSCNAASE